MATSLSSSEPSSPILLTASTSSTRQTCRPSPKRTDTSSAYNASSYSATASRSTRFPSTTAPQSRSPPRDRRSPYTRQAAQAHSTRRRYRNPSPPAWACRLHTVRAMVNVVWPALLGTLSFLLTMNLSDSPIWQCPWSAAGVRQHGGVSCAAHAARRVPHRARKSRAPITRRLRVQRTATRAAGATLPRLTGGAHSRPRRQR